MDRASAGARGRCGLTLLSSAALGIASFGLAISVGTPRAGASSAGWTLSRAPVPYGVAGPATMFLQATSCPTSTWCLIVGHVQPSGSGDLPLAEVRTGGLLMPQVLPIPSDAEEGVHAQVSLNAVSCVVPSDCVAVGTYVNNTGNLTGLLATHSAVGWRTESAPLPPNASPGNALSSIIDSVSCASISTCVAVGEFRTDTGGEAALVERLIGEAWAPTEIGSPSGALGGAIGSAKLRSVACATPGSCVAVGTYTTSSTGAQGLMAKMSTTQWSTTRAPAPPGPLDPALETITLRSVSCPITSVCVAVGTFKDPLLGAAAVVETLNAGAWTVAKLTPPAGVVGGILEDTVLTSISCPTPGFCGAAGRTVVTSGSGTIDDGLLATETGGHWSSVVAPTDVGAKTMPTKPTFGLGSISCVGTGQCQAVGQSEAGPTGHAVIESYNQGSWVAALAKASNAANTSSASALTSVSCHGTTCIAVGFTSVDNGLVAATGAPLTGGYYEVASDGGIFAFGATFQGSMGGKPLNKPIVGAAYDPVTGGYFEVASDGGLFAFGAHFDGSMGGKPLNKPIVGMAFDPITNGYWEVASDGGIFSFTAPFEGSMGGKHLNLPIVAIAFDPLTGGYYEVASDGGIFSFGAPFAGSMGGKPLNRPIVAIAPALVAGGTGTRPVVGYYEVASDGGVFSFGVPFPGSLGGRNLVAPVVGAASDPIHGGLDMVAADGGLFSFSGSPFQGSMGGRPLVAPIIAIATA